MSPSSADEVLAKGVQFIVQGFSAGHVLVAGVELKLAFVRGIPQTDLHGAQMPLGVPESFFRRKDGSCFLVQLLHSLESSLRA